MRTSFIRLLTSLLLLVYGLTLHATEPDEFRVVGYFASWNDVQPMAKSLDYSKVTHLNYCFTNVTDNVGSLSEMGADLDTVVKYAHAHDVKVLISMGGGSMSEQQINDYLELISTQEKRAMFCDSIQNYLERYNLDGFDVDIEGPRINEDYGAFIKQLVDSLRPKGKLITAALGDWGGENVPEEVVPLFDFINIMSYDATGSWSPNNVGQHSSYELALQGIEKWASRGAAKENLVVGLPFYGYAFNELSHLGFVYYRDILDTYPHAHDQDTVGDIIFYNGISTIQRKTTLALDSAGGVMIWELAYDTNDEYSLLKAIDDTRASYNPNDLPPTVTITSPGEDTTITESQLLVSALFEDTDGTFRKSRLFANDVLLGENTDSTDSFLLTNLENGSYTIVVESIDHQFRAGRDTLELTVNTGTNRHAYNNDIVSVPGKIEAEDYDVGGQNISYYDVTDINEGMAYRADKVDIEACYDTGNGFHVGWTSSGEWLEYTINVTETGNYDIDFRAASTHSNNRVSIDIDGEEEASNIALPNSDGWQVWRTASAQEVSLTEGEHVLRLNVSSGSFNLNYMLVKPHVPNAIDHTETTVSHIFPNPAQNTLYARFENVNRGRITIFNTSGKRMLQQSYENNNGTYTELDIASLEPGMYLMKMEGENHSYEHTFIKE